MFCTVTRMYSLLFILTDSISRFILPEAHVESKGSFSAVSSLTEKVDDAFMLILIISLVLLALVTFFMIFFVIRYRQKKNPTPSEVRESLLLEITWTVIPTILVFIMFYVGWANFLTLREVPEDAMPVKVKARMWSWQFEYENGRKSDVLRVPAGQPVKLLITSSDVLHSLFIPAFKLKEDAVPGMETTLWFYSDRQGEYDIYCTEYCGTGHSAMNSKVVVMSGDEFSLWHSRGKEKKGEPALPPSVTELLDENGCLDCHSVDGTTVAGPTFKGIFGRSAVVVTDGKEHEIVVNEEYLKRSILAPDADIVKGYPEIMPSYEGELSGEQIEDIIKYLKGLR